MQITLTIPDELAAQVQARGVALEAYIRKLMEERLSQDRKDDPQRRNAVEAMLQFAESHGFTLDGLGIRSMVHEGHKF